MTDKNKKGKKSVTSPKKVKREAIVLKIKEALSEWKEEWSEKKFEVRVRKAAKLFLDGKPINKKKVVKKNTGSIPEAGTANHE